jgi:hypothetical protein
LPTGAVRGRPLNIRDIFGLPRWPWKRSLKSWIASGRCLRPQSSQPSILEAIPVNLGCSGLY